MPTTRRGREPDPYSARDQAGFRALLRDLQKWAGHTSLEQLETAARRRRGSMPRATANRALNADRLPTADFVKRFVLVCGGDADSWVKARDALADAQADAHYRRDAPAKDRIAEQSDPPAESEGEAALCPYPGLAAFGPDQAQWFFGRERATAELVGLLADRLAGTGPLVVVGPSGVGKSSLLGAGLASALDEGRLPGYPGVAPVVFTPTAAPMRVLADQLARLTGQDPDEVETTLADDPAQAAGLLRQPDERGPHIILVVDQFEEVFTLCADGQQRQHFVTALCAASTSADPAVLVVLGMRADFYGRCADHPELLAALRHGRCCWVRWTTPSCGRRSSGPRGRRG